MLGEYYASEYENDIYNLLDDYLVGIDLYDYDVIDDITKFLHNQNLRFRLVCSEKLTDGCGTCSVAFVDNGYPILIVFDYTYYKIKENELL